VIRHALIVEGNPTERSSYRIMLERSGFSVVESPTAEIALDEIRERERFDCLVIGDSLPGMKGIELIAKLRRSGNKSGIVITVEDSQAVDMECTTEGMDIWSVLPKSRIVELPKKASDASEYSRADKHKNMLSRTISENLQFLKDLSGVPA